MSKKKRLLSWLCGALLLTSLSVVSSAPAQAAAGPGRCTGKFVNPITDICWSCLFPISIGGLKIWPSSRPDPSNPALPVCLCGLRPGIAMGFWEPVRLADVSMKPWCFVNLGGMKLDPGFDIGFKSMAGPSAVRTWTDSDIGIASEDRSRIFGNLSQMSDSRNWSSTRDGFVRSVSTSSSSSISSTASGMNASLTEAQSFTIEARRAEELANRLESQASFFEGNSAAGSLNLSQAYREWGLAEIESNRDFYGNARFDDVTFQLSPEGQALQAKFIKSYAEQLRDGIDDRLVLAPGLPVSRPAISSAGSVRGRAQTGGGGSGSVPRVGAGDLHEEVQRAQAAGRQKITGSRGRLDAITKGAQGASAEAADDVKEW